MIITLGPEGTYSHQAAQLFFPGEPLAFANSIAEVFSKAGPEDTLVLPLENSSTGRLQEVWKEIEGRHLVVCKTQILKINHAIGSLSINFKKVLAHDQALKQCRRYLRKKYPQVALEAVESNALAVKRAAQDTNAAAIASVETFKIYNLPILEENISDSKNNETCFGVIAPCLKSSLKPF